MRNTLKFIFIAAAVSLFIQGAGPALMSLADQSERVPPTSGIYTGPQWAQKVGDAVRSISTGNKGSSAPANVSGTTVDGLEWIDDSVTPWIKKRYVNGGWAIEGALNPSDSTYAGVIGGGVASVASGTTVDLGSVPQANVTITSTGTIAGFGSAAPTGVVKFIRFAGVNTLTYSSALTVPGGYDLVTAANDRAIVTHLGSGNWEVTQYTRASGIPIDVAAVGEPKFSFQEGTPALHLPGDGRAILRTSYPAYLAKVTRAQNGTRTSGNATIASVADTSKMGVGMPVESTGVNAGCTIASLVANTSITLNSSGCVTSSGTSTVTVFLTGYGSGGDATKVGVPNCGGAVLAGRETTASRLTATYFGGNSTKMAEFSGSESQTLIANQLPSSIPYTDLGHTHTGQVQGSGTYLGNVIVSASPGSNNSGAGFAQVISTSATGITINPSGGNPHRTVQPTLIADCNVRVIP